MKLGRSRAKLALIGASVVVVAVSLALALYYPRGPVFSASCAPVIGGNAAVAQTGLSYSCGAGQASDGRLSVIYHNYRFAEAKNLDFQYGPGQQRVLPDEVFLLVNVTVSNVGGGNASVGGGWSAWVLNGTSWAPTTNFFVNASFPGTYPDEVIPDVNGGLYMPPGAKADLWLIFYLSFGPNVKPSDINQTATYRMQYLTFDDNSYGGTYLGGGKFACQEVACTNPDAELIIRTSTG